MPEWDHAGSRASAGAALEAIALARPAQLRARDLSRLSKLPFKAAFYRDSLLWRIEELGRAALRAYDEGDHVAGILLARGTIETVAALWELHRLVSDYRGDAIDALDEALMKMLMGSRVRDDRPASPNILTALDRMTKSLPDFRAIYDQLSEFAHPNDAGTASSFAKLDIVRLEATFGPAGENHDRRAWLLIEGLATSLLLVLPLYHEVCASFPAFARLCETDAGRLSEG